MNYRSMYLMFSLSEIISLQIFELKNQPTAFSASLYPNLVEQMTVVCGVSVKFKNLIHLFFHFYLLGVPILAEGVKFLQEFLATFVVYLSHKSL